MALMYLLYFMHNKFNFLIVNSINMIDKIVRYDDFDVIKINLH